MYYFEIFRISRSGVNLSQSFPQRIFSFSLEEKLQLIKINSLVLFHMFYNIGFLISSLEVCVMS